MESQDNEVRSGLQPVPQLPKDAAPISPIMEDVACNFTVPSPPIALLSMHGDNSVMNDGDSKLPESGNNSHVPGDTKDLVRDDEPLATKPFEGLSAEVGDNVDMILEQVKRAAAPSDNVDMILEQAKHTAAPSDNGELNNSNKRQALVCDFFARGWCIRGSSCKFLHVKNKVSNSDGKAEGDSAAASSGRDQVNEGSTSTRPIARLPDLTKPTFSSTGKDAITSRFSFDSQMAAQMGGKAISTSLQREGLSNGIPHKSWSLASKDASVFSPPMKDIRTENLARGWPPNDHGSFLSPLNGGSSFLLNNRLLPENRCSSSGLDLKSRSYNDMNSSSLFNGIDNSIRPRSAYMDDDCVGTTSGSGRKPSVSFDDWEPSVPFQPSFLITPVKSSPTRQYDPLRDSIDSPSGIVKSFEFSFISNRISSKKASNEAVKGDLFPNQTISPEVNDERSSIPHHHRFHGSTSDNNCGAPVKESFKHGTPMDIDELADDQSGTMPKEEIASVSNHADVDHKPRSDGSRRRNKADSMDADGKMDQEVHKESKYPRHFRTALISLVKELLKPTWREGHLSKDAHNTIVRKSTEKVLSTMQPHQVPTTAESIKHYLQSSRPKLEKLIEVSSRRGITEVEHLFYA
ncbi:Protein FRIGIDA-ESSENTIAL 1 [Linum perenne]